MVFIRSRVIDVTSLAEDEKPASTSFDVFNDSFASIKLGHEGLSRFRAFEAAYDARSDKIKAAIGVDLGNPYRVQGLAPQEMIDRAESGDAWSFYDKRRRELAEQYPDHRDIIAADRPIAEDAAQLARDAEAKELDTWDRAQGTAKYIAYTAAALYAGVTDPINIAGLGLGPFGAVGVGAKAVIWQGLKTGAINAGVEASVQPIVQSWRQEAGLDYGFSQAALNVAAAGVLGFGIDAGLRGAARGVRRLQGREAELNADGGVIGYKEPGAALRGAADTQDITAPRMADPQADPMRALDEGALLLPDDSPIRRAAHGDAQALRHLAEETGLTNDPAVRGALDVMTRDENDGVPPAGVDAIEHILRLNDAVKAALDDRALPHGDALITPHDEAAGPARLGEVLAQDPVALAGAIRENSEILKEGLPWQDEQLRAAALMSRLSDPAFEMVAGGDVNPKLAALIADHVADPELHARLLRQLNNAAPRTQAEARQTLAGLLETPRTAETHAVISGAIAPIERPPSLIDDPAGPDAARQLESLRQQFADDIKLATASTAEDARPSGATSAKVGARGDATAKAKAVDDLASALDAAIGKLPRGVTAKSFKDIDDLPTALRRDVMFARLAGYNMAGLTDRATGNIWIAHDALSPDGVIGHETVHALRQTGVLKDAELQVLAKKAAQFPNLYNRQAYEQLYAGQPHATDALLQEAAAHLYEARTNGANFGGEANAILYKIRQFLERLRNRLEGLGWLSADDVMRAIDRGEIGARAARSDGALFKFTDYFLQTGIDDLARRHDATSILKLRPWSQHPGRVLAFHGTEAVFDRFDLSKMQDFGVHFGTADQANKFAEGTAYRPTSRTAGEQGSVLPVVLDLQKVIDLPDLNRWTPAQMLSELDKQGIKLDSGARQALRRAIDIRQREAAYRVMRDELTRQGYDGIRYLNGAEGGGLTWSYIVWDQGKVRSATTDAVLFSLREDGHAQLRADLEALKEIKDANVKAQRERQALLDERVRQRNEQFMTTLRDARGQVDPAKALIYLIENHGEVDMPAGFASVAGEAKAIENLAKSSMEALLHEFRPQLGTGKTRNTARLQNVLRELSGEGTGDAAAKGLAQMWSATHERLRQEFNATGGDIPKLAGWFLPQVHNRAALLAVGPEKWVNDIARLLSRERIIDNDTGLPISRENLRVALRDIWQNITSDGHGTQADNALAPFGGVTGDVTGAKKLANQRQEHRFLHFKNADAWTEYQTMYGGGGDAFGAMMAHVRSMSKDIAAMRILGSNPNRELARLAKFTKKQAALAKPAARLIDDAVSKVKMLSEELLAAPTRLNEVSDRIGAIHKELDDIRSKRIGPPSRRSKKKIEVLWTELFSLDAERLKLLHGGRLRIDGIDGARIRAELDAAFEELGATQNADRVLFPRKTEFLGKTMDRSGFWTTSPDDYASRYIARAEAMWDLYRGVTSAPVNAKAAQYMQGARNVAVIGRGGSMVISSIADNFAQVMARRFTGLPLHTTLTDILKQFGRGNAREATRNGLIGETYLHMFNDGARHAASLQGPAWSNYLAERTIALSGMNALTDAQRRGFGMSIQGALRDLADKSLADIDALNPRLRKLFERYGLSAEDWDAIRLDPNTGVVRDVDFLSPNAVRDSLEAAGRGGERIVERYLGMILQESDFASPTAMLRARAALIGQNRPGTLIGEILRTGTQFKSFTVMFWMLHVERQLRQAVSRGPLKGAQLAGEVAIAMMLGGALVVQLKELKSGRDVQPMDNANFWYRAMLQGGGLGIMGDLLAAETNRFGGGIISTVGGPVVGLAEDILRPAANLYKRKESNVGRDVSKLATGYVPGTSLWYFNLAWKRIAADRLQEYLDPQAYDMFSRSIQSQRRDYGNDYWWGPGDRKAQRGPRLDAVVGGR